MPLNILRAFSVTFVSITVILCLKKATLFSLHPSMMSFAFMVLMVEGILFLHPRNTFSRTWSKSRKARSHWIIQIFGGLSVGLGFLSIYLVKISNGKDHFTTWHGLLGVVTCCFVLCTMLIGTTTLHKVKFVSFIKPKRLKILHRYIGVLTLVFGLLCIGFGYYSSWAENQLSKIAQIGLVVLLIPFSTTVLYLITQV